MLSEAKHLDPAETLRSAQVDGPREFHQARWICVALAGITLLIYFRSYQSKFVNYDDDVYVYENQHVRTGLTLTNLRWAIGTGDISYWHPITWASHMLDAQLYGMNPAGHHASSVMFHAAAGVLLFLLLRRMTGAEWRSAMVAALFAWHPQHVESVAWISERKDTLSAIFWILAIWAYVRFTERMTVGRYCMAMLTYLAALMSKPTTVSLPVILFLLDFWPLARLSRPTALRRIVEKIPFFLLAAGVSIVTIHAQRAVGVVGDLQMFTPGIRIANAIVACAMYMMKMFFPTSLAAFYPHPATIAGGAVPAEHVVAGGALLAACTTLALTQIKKRPYLAVGWLWFIVALLPMLGLVQVGVQARADRYTYIPLIGLFIAIVWAWPARAGKNLTVSIASIALAACLLITIHQTRFWTNSFALFDHAIDVTRDNYLAYYKRGTILVQNNQLAAAANDFKAAAMISPGYAAPNADLGSVLIKLRQPAEAEKHLRVAIDLDPNYPPAHEHLADLLSARGQLGDAENHYRQALRLRQDFMAAHVGLAQVLAETFRGGEAVPHFREALRLQPDQPQALAGLAWVLATDSDEKVRDIRQSLALAQRAAQLTSYSDAKSLDALAAATAQSGNFPQAEAIARRAADIATRRGNESLAGEILKRAELYKAGHVFIMMPSPAKGE